MLVTILVLDRQVEHLKLLYSADSKSYLVVCARFPENG